MHRNSSVDVWLPINQPNKTMINDLAKDAAIPPPLPASISRESSQTISTTSSRCSTLDNANGSKPNINGLLSLPSSALNDNKNVKPSSFTSSTSSIASTATTSPRRLHRADTAKLKEYGQCFRRLGEGSTAVVMITRKLKGNSEKLYAIKQFRKRQRSESEKQYMKKLTSEFCISSTFSHRNIVETIDLVLDDRKRYSTVMEYVCT
jgi:hypothetical protein